MHREGARVGDVVGHAVPGERGMALLVLETTSGCFRVAPRTLVA